MLFYTVGQSRIFLTMMYAGLAIGLYLSADRALRRLFAAGSLLSAVMDLLFGIISACIVLCALMKASGGELRLYALMGTICGYLIYSATLGPLLSRLFCALIRPCRAVFHWLKSRTFLQKFFR